MSLSLHEKVLAEVNIQCQRSGVDWSGWRETTGLFCLELELACNDVCVCVISLGSAEWRTQDSSVWTRHPTSTFLQLYGKRPGRTQCHHRGRKITQYQDEIAASNSCLLHEQQRVSKVFCRGLCVTAVSWGVWCVPQYLACLKTSRSQTDKLSFDVGLQEDSTGKTKAPYSSAFIHLFSLFHSRCFCPSLSVPVFVPVSLPLNLSLSHYPSLCLSFSLS